MIAYRFDERTKEYLGTQECQKDPLESKIQGKDIFLTPAFCVLEKPEEKSGYAPVWGGAAWALVEDHRGQNYYPAGSSWDSVPSIMKDLGPFPDGSTLTPPQKTAEQIKQDRISELRFELKKTDYVVIKIAEGRATKEQYAQVLADREAWREEIRALEG